MITSHANPKIKNVRRLQTDKRFRSQSKAFIVEGTRWLKEFVGSEGQPQQIYYTEDWLAEPNHDNILAQIEGSKQLVSPQVMQSMSATESSPGVLAVASIQPLPIPAELTFVLILDGLADPGNMGTLLRTAAGTGVDVVLLAPGCVDIYNPKVVRAAMGAHVRLPIWSFAWEEMVEIVNGLAVRLAAADGVTLYNAANWREPSALILGNEAHGASLQARQIAFESVYIPLAAGVESLNASIAGAVIMFEVVRQRNL